MWSRRSAGSRSALAGLAVLCVASCTGPDRPSNDGPIPGDPDGYESATCAPSKNGTVYFGSIPVDNTGDHTAVITAVELQDDEGLDLSAAYLVPATRNSLGSSTRPGRDGLKGWRWDERTPALSADVHPGAQYELVLRLTTTGTSSGHSGSVYVQYTSDSTPYQAIYVRGFSIVPGGQPCTDTTV